MADRYFCVDQNNNTHVVAGRTNWSTTSGAKDNASEPTANDLVYLDGNSGGGCTVNAALACTGFDCVGGTGGAYTSTLTHNGGVITFGLASTTSVIRLNSTMTYVNGSNWTKAGANNITMNVTTAGNTFSGFVLSAAATGDVINFQDDFTVANALSLRGTTLTMNGHTVTATTVAAVLAGVINWSSNAASKFIITGTGTVFGAASNMTHSNLVAGNEVRITNATATSKTAAFGPSFSQSNMNLTYASGADNLIIAASTALTLGTIDVSGSTTNGLTFPAGITTTVAGLISSSSATGSAIKSSTPASTYTISCANPVRVNALSVTDCIAAGAGNPFVTVCGTLSNTTNWNIARTNHLPLLAVA